MAKLLPQAYEMIKLMFGGAYADNVKEAKVFRFWDTRYFNSTIDEATFFNVPIGGNWRDGNKTVNETNLTTAGQLPEGQDMIVTGMSVSLIVPSAITDYDTTDLCADFLNLLSSSVFTFTIANKAYEAKIHGSILLPSPMAFAGPQVTTANANDPVTHGRILGYGWWNFKPVPIPIGARESFKGTHTIENPVAAYDAILDASASALSTQEATMQWTMRGITTHKK